MNNYISNPSSKTSPLISPSKSYLKKMGQGFSYTWTVFTNKISFLLTRLSKIISLIFQNKSAHYTYKQSLNSSLKDKYKTITPIHPQGSQVTASISSHSKRALNLNAESKEIENKDNDFYDSLSTLFNQSETISSTQSLAKKEKAQVDPEPTTQNDKNLPLRNKGIQRQKPRIGRFSTATTPFSKIKQPFISFFDWFMSDPQLKNLKLVGIDKPYKLIECGGGGDCQLHAFLKGLEMHYPELASYTENDKTIPFTHEKLRQLGVQFAKNILSQKDGVYLNSLKAYLAADRLEYNDTIITPLKSSYERRKKALLLNKKLTQEKLQTQLQLLEQQHTKNLNFRTIPTDELFLNRLNNKGFYCSSLHLFCLSIYFAVPIRVYTVTEQLVVNSTDSPYNVLSQDFNETRSTRPPINLFHYANHYQLIEISQEDTETT